jgi:hypothetical protein
VESGKTKQDKEIADLPTGVYLGVHEHERIARFSAWLRVVKRSKTQARQGKRGFAEGSLLKRKRTRTHCSFFRLVESGKTKQDASKTRKARICRREFT